MKKNIKILSIIIALIIALSITRIVNAVSVNMDLDSSSKLKAGETVEIMLKITGIDTEKGIDAISATIEYDKNVFEEVKQSNLEGINEWNVGQYGEESQIFTILRSEMVNTKSDVLKITLKAKETIDVSSTIVELKDIQASGGAVIDGGTGDIDVNSVKITIYKADEDTTPPTTNTVTDEPTTNTVTGNPGTDVQANTQTNIVPGTQTKTNVITNAQIKTNTATNNNNVGDKLPQTGEGYGIVIAIAVVAIISVIAFVKYRNLNIK